MKSSGELDSVACFFLYLFLLFFILSLLWERWAHVLCHQAELCCCLDYIALSFSQAAGNWGIVVLAVPRSGLSTWQLLASYKQGNQYFRTVAVPSVYNNTIPWHLACLQPMSGPQNSIWHTFRSNSLSSFLFGLLSLTQVSYPSFFFWLNLCSAYGEHKNVLDLLCLHAT